MTTSLVTPSVQDGLLGTSLRQQIDSTIEDLIASLPDPKQLTAEQRRGMIAQIQPRYWKETLSIG